VKVKDVLDQAYLAYHTPGFIEDDPILLPHRFHRPQDIEIAAFFAALLAWGRRRTIINKVTRLLSLMDDAPYDFITGHRERDLKRFLDFRHRTFQPTDLLYFIHFLRHHYHRHASLEDAFLWDGAWRAPTVKQALIGFHEYFFSLEDAPRRTRKHVPTPARRSACKRLNMFMRWMVRRDPDGVDFGLWTRLRPSQLMMPLDVHVERAARHLGLLTRRQRDWQAVEELTDALRRYDPHDPVKYDFALFGIGKGLFN